MRRIALPGLALLLLSGCGFGTFVGNTHTFLLNPDRPIGDSETMRRVRALAVEEQPLQPEPGNVWPGPVPPEPTLADLQRTANQGPAPAPLPNQPPSTPPATPSLPRGLPHGSSTPPADNQPGLSVPGTAAVQPRPGAPLTAPPGSHLYQTPAGTMIGTPSGGVDTLTAPNGASGGIAVPNGNGTTTIIAPNGTITTVPTPK
ncbi:MAG: hypothetical protein JO209_06210 [Acidisphaera sp.]|nr:hypothetical protein [Acidisphaera sp.]